MRFHGEWLALSLLCSIPTASLGQSDFNETMIFNETMVPSMEDSMMGSPSVSDMPTDNSTSETMSPTEKATTMTSDDAMTAMPNEDPIMGTVSPTEEASMMGTTTSSAASTDMPVTNETMPPTEGGTTGAPETPESMAPTPEESVMGSDSDSMPPTKGMMEGETTMVTESVTTGVPGMPESMPPTPEESVMGSDSESMPPTEGMAEGQTTMVTESVTTGAPEMPESMAPTPEGSVMGSDSESIPPTEGETMVMIEGATTGAPEMSESMAPSVEESVMGSDNVEQTETPMGTMPPTMPVEELPALSDGACSPESPCGMCVGDCNDDSDCEGTMECFRRSGNSENPVPGCSGTGVAGRDYCFVPEDNHLRLRGTQCSSENPCNLCEGDCDNDFQCEGDLACYQIASGKTSSVPGCIGVGSGKLLNQS